MKKIFLTCLIMMCHFLTSAQTNVPKFKKQRLNSQYFSQTELKDKLIKYDFSRLFMHTDNSLIYGFIGNNYQRIRIKFIKITKDSLNSGAYHVYGKSMVKTNIREFSGTITISNIRKLKSINYGVDDEYKNKGIKGEYVIIGDYQLSENETLNYTGVFKGSFESEFYLDKKIW